MCIAAAATLCHSLPVPYPLGHYPLAFHILIPLSPLPTQTGCGILEKWEINLHCALLKAHLVSPTVCPLKNTPIFATCLLTHSITQSLNHSITQPPTTHSITQSLYHPPISHSITQSLNHPLNHPLNHSITHSFTQPLNHSLITPHSFHSPTPTHPHLLHYYIFACSYIHVTVVVWGPGHF